MTFVVTRSLCHLHKVYGTSAIWYFIPEKLQNADLMFFLPLQAHHLQRFLCDIDLADVCENGCYTRFVLPMRLPQEPLLRLTRSASFRTSILRASDATSLVRLVDVCFEPLEPCPQRTRAF